MHSKVCVCAAPISKPIESKKCQQPPIYYAVAHRSKLSEHTVPHSLTFSLPLSHVNVREHKHTIAHEQICSCCQYSEGGKTCAGTQQIPEASGNVIHGCDKQQNCWPQPTTISQAEGQTTFCTHEIHESIYKLRPTMYCTILFSTTFSTRLIVRIVRSRCYM